MILFECGNCGKNIGEFEFKNFNSYCIGCERLY